MEADIADGHVKTEVEKIQTRGSGKKGPPNLTSELLEQRDDIVDIEALNDCSQRIHGFSGREIAKLFTALQTHVLFAERQEEVSSWTSRLSPSGRQAAKHKAKSLKAMTKDLLFEVVDQKVKEHNTSRNFQAAGYEYQNQEEPPEMTAGSS